MSRNFTTTLTMAVVALLTASLAAFYYPWPEIERVDERVNKSIFDFDSNKVRAIQIVEYDDDVQSMRAIDLRRRSSLDAWSLPGFSNFNAGNVPRISALLTALQNKVLESVSSDQEDFAKYGVVDPDEIASTPNKSFLGKKVTLKDNNQKTLASLIVGSPPQDTNKQGQAYVRIAGQPNVYLVEFNRLMLSTQFQAWVNPNLLGLGQGGEFPERILIENFRINIDDSGKRSREDFYRVGFQLTNENVVMTGLELKKNGEWGMARPTEEQVQLLQQNLARLLGLEFVGVSAIPSVLSDALVDPMKPATAEALDSLSRLGFLPNTESQLPRDLTSTGGVIEVTTRSKVVLRLLFGSVVPSMATSSKFARNLIIMAYPDVASLPKPEEPKPANGQALTEDEQKEYLRAVEAWDTEMKRAMNIADGYNQLHRKWVYMVDEDVVSALRPELPEMSVVPSAAADETRAAKDSGETKPAEESKATEDAPDNSNGTRGGESAEGSGEQAVPESNENGQGG